MKDFCYHSPETIDEALSILTEHGEDARPISGGTAMVNLLKQSLVFANHMVSLRKLPGMSDISFADGQLRVGALVSHQEMVTSDLVKEHVPLLSEVYSRIATVKIRNMGTVGGGLAHADPSQDPPPALIILGAQVRLVSGRGERVLEVSDLFNDYYETAIEPGEILTEIIVPAADQDATSAYLKFLPRTADDYPTVGVAVTAKVEGDRFVSVGIALNAVAPTPVRASAVEEALVGQQVTGEAIRDASELVRQHLDPLDDYRGSADYKRDMAVVFTRRALQQVAGLSE